MSKPRILIAGAGIGGIVAALALLQKGYDVALYEQAIELREIGAGVQISPNGSRVLCELGLREAMEAIASIPTAKEMRLFNTGQAWRVQDLGANAVARFGFPYWLVHRADFHAVLVACPRRARAQCRACRRPLHRTSTRPKPASRSTSNPASASRATHSSAPTACTPASAKSCSAGPAPPSPASWPGAVWYRWTDSPRISASNTA